MLYYNLKNYDEFKELFEIIKYGNDNKSRKNKILLAYLKDKDLLHQAVASNEYTFLHISDMSELEQRLQNEIRVSGLEDKSLSYELRLINQTYYSAIYETDEYQGLCEDGDPKCVRYYNHQSGRIFKMKAGKLYRQLILETNFGKGLPEQVINYLCEEFAAKWQTFTIGRLPKNKLHVNQDFERIYSSECCEGDFYSCMVDKGYHGFYEYSVNASAAYLENENGKVIARCIIYNKAKDQDGKNWKRIVDRSNSFYDTPHDYVEMEYPARVRYIRYKNIHVPTPYLSISAIRIFGLGEGKKPQPVNRFEINRHEDRRDVTIKWQPVKNAQGYNIMWGIAPDKLYSSWMVYGNDGEHLLKCLNTDQEYYFAIEAFNENGVSKLSEVKKIE